MAEEGFEDLLAESELLQDSSRESFVAHAANHSDRTDAADTYAQCIITDNNGPHMPHGDGETFAQDQYHILDGIESVFERMVDALLNDRNEVSINLANRRTFTQRAVTSEGATAQIKPLRFPGGTAEEAWRFAMVARIMGLIIEAVRTGVVLSKRDLFYQDPALFGSQSQVNRYVDDIALTFGVSRATLNIVAAAKGLVAGAVKFFRRDGSVVDAASDHEGLLVPLLKDILAVDMHSVNWILVIEKEASFRSIASSSFWGKISEEGIIVTGKGYPDLSTRALLRFLSTASANNGFACPPVYGLADYDPDGVAILATYKRGSKALAHENSQHCVPQLQWLGLRSDHLLLDPNSSATQGLLGLTARDRKKALQVLRSEHAHECEASMWKTEIQTMMMMNLKAELQLLDATPDGMVDLISSALKMPRSML